ncbi:hypothetical protein [Chryseobacterium indoltheticum]|jgi:hypothetical protein|uniref:hypothetical protein n=1 Tax=Chryseobacterium indoltheticum TaxID=254 RepID=UPI00242E391D|nr:hypothetical protein [Chryseobacterium indoltheticum]MDF2833027.1 Uncharacterized protein [Chryseobacterium indoltheticum]
MATNYYYIDDDSKSTITETAKGLSVNPEKLVVQAFQHKEWDDQIKFIIENQNEFDGLLLDWTLKRKSDEGVDANFNVEALAQQIRRYIIDNDKLKKDFPIVICSADYRFHDIFSREVTGHDLFDLVFAKDEFDSKQYEIINQLEDLSVGYKMITKAKKVEDILKTENLEDIDYRVLDYLQNQIGQPTHEIARFILTKLVKSNGILIDEYLLASRLGVDILTKEQERIEEWNKLLKIIDSTRYKGTFSNAWSNWWMHKINEFWLENFEESLGNLNGAERVNYLNQKFQLQLHPAPILEKAASSDFWVVCKKTHAPLAISDAVLATSDVNRSSWEEDEYFSIEIALQEDVKNIHILEKERVQKLKVEYTKARVR